MYVERSIWSGSSVMSTSNRSWTSFKILASVSSDTKVMAKPKINYIQRTGEDKFTKTIPKILSGFPLKRLCADKPVTRHVFKHHLVPQTESLLPEG